jgi:hypothetical protein
MKTNSIIDDIQIAKPCPISWDGMSGDERVRFCGDCKKHVYNIAEMTRKEAERLIVDTEGKACVRLFRRADGTVITDDCPLAFRKARDTAVRVLSLCASAAMFLFTSVAALAKDPKVAQPDKSKCESVKKQMPAPTMGDVVDPGYFHRMKHPAVMGKVRGPEPASMGEPTMGAPMPPEVNAITPVKTEEAKPVKKPEVKPPKTVPAKTSK